MAKNDSLKPYNEGLKCFQDNMKEDEYMALTKEYCTKNDFQYPEKVCFMLKNILKNNN